MEREITKKQIIILDCIKEFIEENGYSPSIRDICKMSGRTSPATIHSYLKILKRKGYINYIDGLSRSITVVGDKIC